MQKNTLWLLSKTYDNLRGNLAFSSMEMVTLASNLLEAISNQSILMKNDSKSNLVNMKSKCLLWSLRDSDRHINWMTLEGECTASLIDKWIDTNFI